jgi:hypothetical protein
VAEDAQKLSEYTVTLNGLEHTMLLTDEDAKRYGENAKKAGASNKARSEPPNKKA